MMNNKITVLGSANLDTFLTLDRFPKLGETLESHSNEDLCGGKGANQAVAASKVGAEVIFLCQVGNDAAGTKIMNELKESHICIDYINVLSEVSTGHAYILLLKNSGENSIIIVGGANTNWKSPFELPQNFKDTIKSSLILLLQREIPEYVNIKAAKYAKSLNITVVLDCGGVNTDISEELLQYVDIISPNESELERISGLIINNENDALDAVNQIQNKYKSIDFLIKLGEKGSLFVSSKNKNIIKMDAFKNNTLKIIDTTGAGDCFIASFCAEKIKGSNISECMRFANASAFLCITKKGAMPSMPNREHVENFLKTIE